MKRRNISVGGKGSALRYVHVCSLRARATSGRLLLGSTNMACALGRSGITFAKREGDGATPAGRHPLRRIWFSAHFPASPVLLPLRRTRADDGWCDAPGDANYNRRVRLPFRASAESMLRQDGLYGHLIEIGWNDSPRRQGRGSAIFLHVARPGYLPTEGCVAIAAKDFRKLLPRIGPQTRLLVRDKPRPVRR